MEFRLLGPFEVAEGGCLLDLGSPKQRAVLAVLAINANRVVSLDRLIDELWGEEPPARAIGSLQAYVSNLRRVLEPDRPPGHPPRVLVTQAPGYLLAAEPGTIDAVRFVAAAAEGHRLLGANQPGPATRSLDTALALWRGPALADFAYEPFATAEAARLEELRLVATEDRLQAELDVGTHDTAVAEAEALVAAHPLRERLWGLLMVGLYRCGRQAEALRAYQEARRTLGEELGIEPGPALRRLEADILTQVPALEWRPTPQPESTAAGGSATAAVGSATGAAVAEPESGPASDLAERLIGRRHELARLRAALVDAMTGRGRVVLVQGEPGIGKTRLVEELVAEAEARRASAVWGRSLEGGGTPAYWPWVGVVRSLAAQADAAAVRRALAPGAVELAQIVPEVKELAGPLDAPAALDPETARLRLFEAVEGLVFTMSRDRPLVVVLDDLQWADGPSLQLLSFLGSRVREVPLLVVGTFRPAEVGPTHPLTDTLAALARHQVTEHLELDGLAAGDVGLLLAATTGAPASPGVVESVVARTDGNPFFVAELARLLVSEHHLNPDALANEVPAGVRDVLRRRLGRLPEQTIALLSLAALVGRDFDVDVLQIAADLDGDRTLELVEAAMMSGLVVEHAEVVGRFRFSHDLVRETVTADLSAVRCARLHARLADALEARRGGDADTAVALAHHLYQAAPVIGVERPISAACRAAEVAAGRLAHEQAEEQLNRALELAGRLPDGPDRYRLELGVVLQLSLLLMMTRGYGAPHTGDAFTRARALCERLGETSQIVRVLYGLTAYHLNGARHDDGRQLANELLEVAIRSDRPADLVVAHQAVGVMAQFQGQNAAAQSHIEQALALPEGLHAPELVAWFPFHPVVGALTFHSQCLWMAGRRDEARDTACRAARFAEEVDHDLSTAHALNFVAWIATLDHDAESARPAAQRSLTFAREKNIPLYLGLNAALHGWARAHLGEVEAGVGEIEAGIAAFEATGAWMLHTAFLALRAEAERLARRAEKALASVDEGIGLVERTGERFWEAELHRLRGELLLELSPSAVEAAEEELCTAVRIARAQDARPLEARAAESLARLGRPAP